MYRTGIFFLGESSGIKCIVILQYTSIDKSGFVPWCSLISFPLELWEQILWLTYEQFHTWMTVWFLKKYLPWQGKAWVFLQMHVYVYNRHLSTLVVHFKGYSWSISGIQLIKIMYEITRNEIKWKRNFILDLLLRSIEFVHSGNSKYLDW